MSDPRPAAAPALPPAFVLGTSGPPHELDSALGVRGTGTSIWDVFAAADGRITDGTRPADASSVPPARAAALLAGLGVGAHRTIASWARLQPTGRGRLDPAAVGHLRTVLEAIRSAGVDNWLTVPAGSLPTALMLEGGWLTRDTAARFADFTGLLAAAVADLVTAWQPLSEMFSHLAHGYAAGVDAPGLTLLDGALPVARRLLLAHGRAVAALRAHGVGTIGAAVELAAISPVGPADRVAARLFETFAHTQFLDPLVAGRRPRAWDLDDDITADTTTDMADSAAQSSSGATAGPAAHPAADAAAEELRVIGEPVDFLGVDFLGPVLVAAAPGNRRVPFSFPEATDGRVTDAGAPIRPGSLTRALIDLVRGRPDLPPLFLTGVGAPLADETAGADFLTDHLSAAAAAITAGVDLRGYFHRSSWDGWAGAAGVTHRTGLVEVDHRSGALRPRAAYHRYAALIGARRP